jgi:uncharacterized protein involved in outer membrane biogenesis
MAVAAQWTPFPVCSMHCRFAMPMSMPTPSPSPAAPVSFAEGTATSDKHGAMKARWWTLGVLLALVLAVVGCEVAGWPFLVGPLQRTLAKAMKREVRFGNEEGKATRIHLFGSIRIRTPGLWVGAPDWSRQPYFVDARDVELALPYSSLWHMRDGEALRVRALDVGRISVRAERDAQGRSSWQFGEPPGKPKAAGPSALPEFDRLHVGSGDVVYDDAPLKLHVDASVQTDEGSEAVRRAGTPSGGLRVVLKGRYDKAPLDGRFESSGALALVARDAPPVPVRLRLDVGRVALRFDGTATDALSLGGLTGIFKVSGPSLAAVGEPLHVTLPSTDAFSLDGRLRKDDLLWNVVVDHAVVGTSQLSGAFQYDRRPDVPTLNGELKGRHVLLADLAPTVGAAPAGKTTTAPDGRKLPQREFDMPSLRAMDANVRVDFARLELGAVFARPLSPLRAQLVLKGGLLTIDDIDAATADGRLRGVVRLDGRGRPAKFDTDLRLSNVDLARWLLLPRKSGQPPYVTGRLDGRITLKGAGNSTAALLGSADGKVHANVRNGTVSHLIVEASGIDFAQALGMLVKGDDSLKMSCAVADFNVRDGVLKPNAVLVDTRDSTITVDGRISLVDEQLDLRATVSPKDFSPLALRSPVLVRGSFAHPRVSLEAAPVARKLAGSMLLGLVTPLAALIPLIDTGDGKPQVASECRDLLARLNAGAKPAAAGPAASGTPPSQDSRRKAAPARPAVVPAAHP